MKKRILPLLCALVLTVGMLLPGLTAFADEITVYQTAINEKLLPLSGDSMPAVIGGTYYVPYTVFDRDVTGVNLGVSYGQWKTEERHTLTIYSLSGLLTFDIDKGTCVDGSGTPVNMRAVLRNGKVYIPVAGVCGFFGLRVTYTNTDYGILVRITNDKAVLSTERFADAATSLMRQRYNNYVKSLTPPTPVTPEPPPETPTEEPTTPPTEGDRRNIRTYFAFRCTGDEGLDRILDLLERYRISALFCFAPEDLLACDGQIRRIVGSGHMVGLTVPGELEGGALTDYVAEGERLLTRIAHLRPHILMPLGNGAALAALEEQGWALWMGNIDGTGGRGTVARMTQTILDAADAKQSRAAITMDDSAAAADVLIHVLPELRAAHYSIRLPSEPEL